MLFGPRDGRNKSRDCASRPPTDNIAMGLFRGFMVCVTALGLVTSMAASAATVTRGDADDGLAAYLYGDAIPIECMNRSMCVYYFFYLPPSPPAKLTIKRIEKLASMYRTATTISNGSPSRPATRPASHSSYTMAARPSYDARSHP